MFEIHITASGVVEGVLMYTLTHSIILLIKKLIHGTERTAAIYWHYYYHAKGINHFEKTVFACRSGRCSLF